MQENKGESMIRINQVASKNEEAEEDKEKEEEMMRRIARYAR
jgi:hypothetical protein